MDERLQARSVSDARAQTPTPTASSTPAATARVEQLPTETQFLDDLERVFALARAGGLTLAAIDYQTEEIGQIAVVARKLELRTTATYSTVKPVLARVLEAMPHVGIQELRVQRRDEKLTEGQFHITLVMFYRLDLSNPSANRKASP